MSTRRVVVMGAGIAGLVAANRLADAGLKVTLLTKGIGGLQLGQGTIDVLGYAPERVANPVAAVAAATDHPYETIGADNVRAGLAYLKGLLPDLLVGEPERNFQFPTAVGSIRPTCLAQPSMVAGDCSGSGTDGLVANAEVLVVGLRQLKDFQAHLVADNLTRAKVSARHVYLDFAARDGETDSTGLTYARSFDQPEFRAAFVAALKRHLRPGEIAALPAVLGIKDHLAWQDVRDRLGHDLFEIPLPPPSVPGMRLNEALTQAARAAGVRIVNGTRTVSFRAEPVGTVSSGEGAAADAQRIAGVTIATIPAGREFTADAFLLANGGFESGSLTMSSFGDVHEMLFNLPLAGLDQTPLLHGDYWGAEQPLFKVGVRVDPDMAVLNSDGDRVYANLWAAGGILAGTPGWADKSGDGIALGSAVAAADAIVKELS